jgi:hypothetical protein
MLKSYYIVLCTVLLYACKESSGKPVVLDKEEVKSETRAENIDTSLRMFTGDSLNYLERVNALKTDSLRGDTIREHVVPMRGALLPYNRIVAYYGNFYSKHMGILGELSEEAMLAKLKEESEQWYRADKTTPVIPAIHYIAITAQSSPGKSGLYRLRMPDKQINRAVELGKRIGGLTFLDVQVGHSTVQNEVPYLESYLKEKHVHLALDPEWSMKDGAKPGKKIGTMDAADVNYAIQYLTKLVKQHDLPPKILVVHRFTKGMITQYKKIKPTPQVQVIVNMDGFGFPAKKRDSYRRFVGGMTVQFTGFKLFYKNDKKDPPYRLMTPQEILKLHPKPVYIQYQ